MVVVAGAAGGTYATGRADDVLAALGVAPQPLSDPGDDRIAVRARGDLDALLDLATSADVPEPVLTALRAQANALPAALEPSAALSGSFVEACRAQARARADDVERAVSPELAVVLASITAGLDQCVRAAS